MIYILLILLAESDSEELIEAFNTMDRERKKIIINGLKKLFVEEFSLEIMIYKRIYKEYKDKKAALAILYEFALEQGLITEDFSIENDIDFQLFNNFNDVDSLEDMAH